MDENRLEKKSLRRFVVHIVINLEDSKKKLLQLQQNGFTIIGIEVQQSLTKILPLHHNILHDGGFPACVAVFGFRNLSHLNCLVVVKPDLDSLMTVAILKKIAYRETFTEEEIPKIDLIARQDVGHSLDEKEQQTVAKIMNLVSQSKFFEKWKVVYEWLIGKSELAEVEPLYKQSRQLVLEKFGQVLVVISCGTGAFSRRYFKSFGYCLALNPDFPLLNKKRGRRYCISSLYNLEEVIVKLNEIDPSKGWGGHANIICSSPVQPSGLELSDIASLINKEDGINEFANNTAKVSGQAG